MDKQTQSESKISHESNPDLQTLQENIRGRVILPSASDFKASFQSWNHAHSASCPSLIINCKGTNDVVTAVNYVREHKLDFTVGGGRHSKYSIKENAVMIDLSGLDAVIINSKEKTAIVQGGVRLGDLDRECSRVGLYCPSGTHPSTGFSGLTLGGGWGYLTRRYGFSCEQILSVEVVLADGQVVTASDDENQDLFFGIRGGTSNFGIVTQFVVKLYSVGHVATHGNDEMKGKVLGGPQIYPIEHATKLYMHLHSVVEEMDQDLTFLAMMGFSPVDQSPVVVFVPSYTGTNIEQGKKLIASTFTIDETTKPLLNMTKPMSYVELQNQLSLQQPAGYWTERSVLLNEITPELINDLKTHFYDHFPKGALPTSGIGITSFATKADAPKTSTAFAHRKVKYWMLFVINYEPQYKEQVLSWANEFPKIADKYKAGVYANTISDLSFEQKLLFLENQEKLQAVKQKYDPQNLFRCNHNVQP